MSISKMNTYCHGINPEPNTQPTNSVLVLRAIKSIKFYTYFILTYLYKSYKYGSGGGEEKETLNALPNLFSLIWEVCCVNLK